MTGRSRLLLCYSNAESLFTVVMQKELACWLPMDTVSSLLPPMLEVSHWPWMSQRKFGCSTHSVCPREYSLGMECIQCSRKHFPQSLLGIGTYAMYCCCCHVAPYSSTRHPSGMVDASYWWSTSRFRMSSLVAIPPRQYYQPSLGRSPLAPRKFEEPAKAVIL